MKVSKYNIFAKIKDSPNYYLVNLLSRNADILDPMEAGYFRKNNFEKSHMQAELASKGYLVDPEREEALFKQKYLDFIEARDSSEIQIFFVPTYRCNFNCSYCYQSAYGNRTQKPDPYVIGAFFDYIDREFSGRNKYITVFGGEPFLPDRGSRDQMAAILDRTAARNLDVAVVTNGYGIEDYLPLLKNARIREIQVTLDGPAEVHNTRRPLKGGRPSFQKISDNIDLLLEKGIPVNLRIVLDKQNLPALPELARYCIGKGWTGHRGFKTQLGRNYELHACQKNNAKLYSRLEMYEELYRLITADPVIMEFHKPAFSISKFLFENGKLPDPLFDSCPACKTEWAFDYTGRIYPCTAMVGKNGESLGTFYPKVQLNQELIEEWQDRDILAMDKCRNCSLNLACGGGCGAVAKNKSGRINQPDCRPVKELMQSGFKFYFKRTSL